MLKKVVVEGKELTVRGSVVKTAAVTAEGYEFIHDPQLAALETRRAARADILTFTQPLTNPDGVWRPGLFVTVQLVESATTVPLAVLAEGIQTFRDWQVVFVKYGDWFEARPLELGRSDGTWVEVLSGLSPGVQYASKNSFAIKAEIGKLGATHDH